jgi:hypothetical protein
MQGSSTGCLIGVDAKVHLPLERIWPKIGFLGDKVLCGDQQNIFHCHQRLRGELQLLPIYSSIDLCGVFSIFPSLDVTMSKPASGLRPRGDV